jgi:pyocin large subunit-like protein
MPNKFIKNLAEKIAKGHSFTKHGHEFNISTTDELRDIVTAIIENPTEIKELSAGRTIYWDSKTGAVVILNPRDPDGGTIFKPRRGKLYSDSLT